MQGQFTTATPEAVRAAEEIYKKWDEALGKKDLEAALALYASDASIESPLVRNLLGTEEGIVQGQDNLRSFIAVVFSRTPPLRQRYRTGFFTDGKKLMWEYPRMTSGEQQMDLVEVMELKDGLIHRHCVYCGWLGTKILETDGYRR